MSASRRSLLPLVALLGLGTAGLGGPGNQALASAESPAALATRVATLLPAAEQTAQLVNRGARIATVNLQQRVTSVGGSPAALRMVLASAARGQVPSYDARLGITREEFGRYLAFQPVLVPSGKSLKLPLLRTPQRLTFPEQPGVPALLRGLSFDLRSGEVEVPEGFTFKPVRVPASTASDRSIDLRGGVQWNLHGYDPISQNGIHGQLSLHQLGSNQVLLTYHRTNMLRGVPGEEAEILLTYFR